MLLAAMSVSVTGAAQAASPPVASATAVVPTDPFNALALDGTGNLYGADCAQGTVYRIDQGAPVLVAGSGRLGFWSDGGPATDAGLYCPFGMVFDHRGMFVLDHGNNRVRLVDPTGTISTFAGSGPANLDTGALTGTRAPSMAAFWGTLSRCWFGCSSTEATPVPLAVTAVAGSSAVTLAPPGRPP
jgi:hypothetical protein